MQYPSYDSYKSSKIDFIEKVPSHWETWKVTHGFGIIGSGTTPKSDNAAYYEDGETAWITTSELREKEILSTKFQLTSEALKDYSALKVYKPGALAFAMYGATIGRLGMLGIDATVNQACCVFDDPEQFHTKFFFYWLWMRRNVLISLSVGGGQPNLSQDDLKQIRAPIPPVNEQQKIAVFLDYKTQQIDQLIEKKKSLIEKLEEKRIAVITQAVTKGLDKGAKLKPSGVDWLGDLPEHWDVRALKFCCYFLNNRRIPLSAEERTGMERNYPYYGASGVIDYVTDYIYDEPTVLIAEDGANLLSRSTDLAFIADGKYWVNNHAHILKPIEGEFDFWANLLCIVNYEPWVTGSAQPKLSKENLGVIPLPYPPIEEQMKISQYIDSQVRKIVPMKMKAQAVVDRLEEYRAAIITSAVTGKIDVRNVEVSA
ncbi:MAG: restriction endonuclease subunit S [Cellvibrionaceae bacterium]